MDLIDIYRSFYLKGSEYTFFSSTHGTFPRIDNMLHHKKSLGKFKKVEIISSIFSDHNALRLESTTRKKKSTKHIHVETKQYATKQPIDHWWNERENQRIPRENVNKSTKIQNIWEAAKAVLRKFIAIQSYLRKQEKSQINNLILHLKQLKRE